MAAKRVKMSPYDKRHPDYHYNMMQSQKRASAAAPLTTAGTVAGFHLGGVKGALVGGAVLGTAASVRAAKRYPNSPRDAWLPGPAKDKGQPAKKRTNPNDSAFNKGVKAGAAGQKVPKTQRATATPVGRRKR